jgi:hypothetical protein
MKMADQAEMCLLVNSYEKKYYDKHIWTAAGNTVLFTQKVLKRKKNYWK